MVSKEFRVVSLHQSFDESVVLELYPIFRIEPPPTPPILQPEPVTVQEPSPERVIVEEVPKTEEEKIARGLMRGMISEFKKAGLFPTPLPTPQIAPIPIRSDYLTIRLTREEYEELKPTIGQVITVTLNLKGESNV